MAGAVANLQIRRISATSLRKRVICNVSASTSWSSAAAPPSMSNWQIISYNSKSSNITLPFAKGLQPR